MPVKGVDIPEQWITPEILEWAREQVHLSLEQASNELKIAPAVLHAWETGEMWPSLNDLHQLSDLYDCPTGYFFLETPPASKRAALDFRGVLRGKEDSLGHDSVKELRRFVRIAELIANSLEERGVTWDAAIPSLGLDESQIEKSVKSALASLGVTEEKRSEWRNAREAYEGWRAAIENQGVMVIALKLNSSDVRGASFWHSPKPPFILVNREDAEAAQGRIFTLLHEYAHLLMRDNGVACDFRGRNAGEAMERVANKFAAEAIVPRQKFIARLKELELTSYREAWNDSTLDLIRAPFYASRDTAAILLEQLKLAPAGHYWERRLVWDKRKPFGRGGRGGGVSKQQRALNNLGRNAIRALAMARQRDVVSLADAAMVLDMKAEDAGAFLAATLSE